MFYTGLIVGAILGVFITAIVLVLAKDIIRSYKTKLYHKKDTTSSETDNIHTSDDPLSPYIGTGEEVDTETEKEKWLTKIGN